MDLRSRNLRNMLKRASKVGIPRAKRGKANPTTVWVLVAHKTLEEAMVRPRKRLPQSPINILAGLKLKNKKPVKAPKRESIMIVITGRPRYKVSIAITPQAAAQIPAARPSRPSMKFTALVIPIIQKIVSGQENHPKLMTSELVIETECIRIPA